MPAAAIIMVPHRRLGPRRLRPLRRSRLTAPAEETKPGRPADGFERFAYSALANIMSGVAFALILVAVSEFAGGIANWRQGVFWGFAGFAVFTLAPGLGLPPELPAMPAADLVARQIWWTMTVVGDRGRTGAHRLPAVAAAGHPRRRADRCAAHHRRAAAREPRFADPGRSASPLRRCGDDHQPGVLGGARCCRRSWCAAASWGRSRRAARPPCLRG